MVFAHRQMIFDEWEVETAAFAPDVVNEASVPDFVESRGRFHGAFEQISKQ